ncbi:DUF4145 domain-containing protein [Merdibacter massiliensis]|uniref:DUF4145 domain-containing protein n=1 Tax=Merdibacter massiliensis TaxID=1871030 RepID=UPI00096AA9D4|nr:DUF4145 domain-containing protein [Merdibacter massiliensis]
MPKSFTCPYCDSVFPLVEGTTIKEYHPSFDNVRSKKELGVHMIDEKNPSFESEVAISFLKCPQCGEYSIKVHGVGNKVKSINTSIKPISLAQQFPEYVPKAIRNDYEEAYAILNLSPKSSATLARRCLQGMIHDFWDIHEKNLNAEITSLRDKVSPTLWRVLDGIRSIGNIGAHMEHDIDKIIDIEPDEAVKLIKLIEFLIKEWYINRYEQEQLFSDIIGIAETKASERKGNK